MRLRPALLTCAALLVTGLVPVTTAVASPPPTVPVIDWQPCGADFPGLDCSVVDVPLDYDHPHAATTSVALARKPASDPSRRIGSLFLNPGGPGGSGVETVLFGFGEYLDENLQGRFDIVGFDPRGVGASDPLHCFDSEEELDAFFDGVPAFPYRRAQERPFYERYRSLGPECLDDDRTIARHMSTADVARDLDLLRRAVGDARLSYLGFSYGSYLGNTYANLFPRTIRALVIDGVLDPRLWGTGWHIAIDRIETQKEFDEFLRLCDEAGPDCAFAAPGGSAARWTALGDAIRAEPLDLGDGFLYTYDVLYGDASSSLYAPASWGGAEGYAALFDYVADAALDGSPAAAARVAPIRAALRERLTPPSRPHREADYPNGFDSYNGNVCADAEFPATLTGYRLGDAYAAAGSRMGPYWWWGNAACADWPTAPDRFAGPWSARTSAPVLVVGNHFDGVTGFPGAQASARLLGGRLLAYAGWGHTAYGVSDCVTAHVNAYLLAGTLPATGTVCPANPNPFLPDAMRTAATTPRIAYPPTWLLR